jgi:hypothetical protein
LSYYAHSSWRNSKDKQGSARIAAGPWVCRQFNPYSRDAPTKVQWNDSLQNCPARLRRPQHHITFPSWRPRLSASAAAPARAARLPHPLFPRRVIGQHFERTLHLVRVRPLDRVPISTDDPRRTPESMICLMLAIIRDDGESLHPNFFALFTRLGISIRGGPPGVMHPPW